MGTPAEKLAYLAKTKKMIRAAIEGKGVEITDQTKFRDYAQKISDIRTENPLEAIAIKGFSGQTVQWSNQDTEMMHRLEIENITPDDATVKVRDVLGAAPEVQWESSDGAVVQIIRAEEDGAVNFYATPVGTGTATVKAKLLNIVDSFTVNVEMVGPLYTLRAAGIAGRAQTSHPVGTELENQWKDVAANTIHDIPLVVAHYCSEKLEDGRTHRGVWVQMKYCLPFATPFDAIESGGGNSRNSYGYNYWKESNIRQWLNSDKSAGAWFTKQNSYDVAPSYSSKAGFLTGCSDELLTLAKPVEVATKGNTVNLGGVVEKTFDFTTLPSVENVYGDPTPSYAAGRGVEGEPWALYKQKTGLSSGSNGSNSGRIIRDPSGTARDVWLRSAYTNIAVNAWYVNTGGNLSNYYAYDDSFACPAWFIPFD